MDSKSLIELQQRAHGVHASPALLDYVQALVNYTRRTSKFLSGLSPRAALALLHAARAWALMDGRNHVVPEDVQAVLSGVVAHRLTGTGDSTPSAGTDVADLLLEQVPVP